AKNVFTGIKPPKPPEEKKDRSKEEGSKEPRRPREKDEDVLAFVKLTMLCYDTDSGRWYATVYDQAKGGNETRLSKALNELTIYDKYHEVSLDATVVHVDGKQLVFRVERGGEKKFFRLKIGDFIYPIYPKQPMSRSELKELGLVNVTPE